LWDAEVGFKERALQLGRRSSNEEQADYMRLLLALIFARAGDSRAARKIAGELGRENPSDTLVQNYRLPTIEAAVMLNENNPTGAVAVLEKALPYDLACPQQAFDSLYPAYMRGLAYLRMKQGKEAAREFQKLLDNSGIVGRDPIGALVRLQIARAQKIMNNDLAAEQSYREFLVLWKHADPDIPILKQAKAEYARLSTSRPASKIAIDHLFRDDLLTRSEFEIRLNGPDERFGSKSRLIEGGF
jgi:eukaryotic-like serine/threonine-protein kinase